MYLDEAADRSQADHDARIEEVRVGFIFAHERKAYDKWRNKRLSKGRGLVGDALESAVAGIARLFPENVIRGAV